MGFSISQPAETSCVFRTTREGDHVKEFMVCVQTALKNLWLDITIDISENPRAFGAVLPYVLKLQHVLNTHHKALTLKGLRALESTSFVQRMRRDFGIHVMVEPPRATPPPMPSVGIAQGVIDKSKVKGVGPAEDAELWPSAEEINQRFTALRDRLALALKRKRYLESEARNYKERIKSLSGGMQNWQLDQRQMKRLADLESLSALTRAKVHALQRELELLQRDLPVLATEQNKSIIEIRGAFKKEKEAIDKQLADLVKKQEQARADFKKRADARREKLTRVQKQGQGG